MSDDTQHFLHLRRAIASYKTPPCGRRIAGLSGAIPSNKHVSHHEGRIEVRCGGSGGSVVGDCGDSFSTYYNASGWARPSLVARGAARDSTGNLVRFISFSAMSLRLAAGHITRAVQQYCTGNAMYSSQQLPHKPPLLIMGQCSRNKSAADACARGMHAVTSRCTAALPRDGGSPEACCQRPAWHHRHSA